MFTLKFINHTSPITCSTGECRDEELPSVSHVYLRQRDSVEVWYPESSVFQDAVSDLKEQDKDNPELAACHDMYTAIITSNLDSEDPSYYYVAEYEHVYITDSSGKTVHVIK